jgi:hypothetical protein
MVKTHLLHVLLEETEGKALVQLDLLCVPLALQLAVVGEDLVDDGEDMAGALLVVGGWVRGLGRWPGLLGGGPVRLGKWYLLALEIVFVESRAAIAHFTMLCVKEL